MSLEHLAIIVGIAIGALMVLAVLIVFVKKQELAASGLALAALGVVLIGMGVWGNIRVSAAGMELDVVRQEVRRTAEAAAAVAAVADSLTGAVEAQQVGLRTLTAQLRSNGVLPQVQLDSISRFIVPLNVDRTRLDRARVELDSAVLRLDPRRLQRNVPPARQP